MILRPVKSFLMASYIIVCCMFIYTQVVGLDDCCRSLPTELFYSI